MKIRFGRICKKDSQESAGETGKMDTDANQKTKKRRDQEKRKPEEILKNSTQQQPLFSLKDTPLAYYSVVTVLKEREDRLVLRMKADREMFPECLVLKWEKAGGRLEREYGLLSAFCDPCLPKVLGYLNSEQGAFLWREYVEGQTLEERISQGKAMTDMEAAETVEMICRFLARLHSRRPQVIHRDIKASNIVQRSDGSLCVIDLDGCRKYHEGEKKDTLCLGTASTAAPEQFGYGQSDGRSDIYGAGMLLIFLLTGKEERGALSEISEKYLRKIARKATEFDPGQRYQCADEMAEALGAFSRKNELKNGRLWRKNRKKNGRWLLVGLLGGLVTGCVGSAAIMPFFQKETAAGEKIYSFVSEMDQEESKPEATARKNVVFHGSIWEQAIREALGKSEEDVIYTDELARITSLYVCGETICADMPEAFQIYWGMGLQEPVNPSAEPDFAEQEDFKLLSLCTNLRYLTCAACDLQDLTPLEPLQLETLDLSANPVSDISALENMKTLKSLYLNYCPVGEEGLENVCTLPLEYLEINDIGAKDYKAVGKMKTLREIRARNVSKTDLEQICLKNPGLKSLFISGENFGNLESLTGLFGLSDLEELDFGASELNDITGIEKLTGLKKVYLDWNFIEDLSMLSKLDQLEELSIRDLPVKDYTPLLQCPKLRKIICYDEKQKQEIETQLGDCGIEVSL